MENKPIRMSWDTYFMSMAVVASSRATCKRKKVGSIIVRENQVLSTGYNGSIRGQPHCEEIGCMMEDGHCVRTVHSEANAITQAAKHGVSVDGAKIYITASCCWNCFKLLVNSGIKEIVYAESYRFDDKVAESAGKLGIVLKHFPITWE